MKHMFKRKRNFLIKITAILAAVFFTAFGCGGGGGGGGGAGSQLLNIVVTPSDLTKPANISQQYEAVAVYDDGRTIDITNNPDVVWSTSDYNAAVINESGLVDTLEATPEDKPVQIVASFSGKSGSASLRIVDAELESIQVTPADFESPIGISIEYKATGIYSYNNNENYITHDITKDLKLDWSSSNTGAATIVNEGENKGVATTRSSGETTIEATHQIGENTVTGDTSLTVTEEILETITVLPAEKNLPVNFTYQYQAIGTFSDGTTRDMTGDHNLSWTGSDSSIAEIENTGTYKGRVKAVAAGDVDIKASYNIQQDGFSGPKTDTAQLTVTDAVLERVIVDPSEYTMSRGRTHQYSAVGEFSDNSFLDITGDPGTSWFSTEVEVAVVNSAENPGRVYAVGSGTAGITAMHSGITGIGDLTVTDDGIERIEVEPAEAEEPIGVTLQYTARAYYSDGTSRNITSDEHISWISSDETKAVISSEGLATTITTTENGESHNRVEIRASLPGVQAGTAELKILKEDEAALQSIEIQERDQSIPLGHSKQFTALAYYSNGTSRNITSDLNISWVSTDTSVASIGLEGLASTLSAGDTTIKVKYYGMEDETSFTVLGPDEAELESVNVTPPDVSVPKNYEVQYAAEAVYNNGMVINLTGDPNLNWSTSDPDVADIHYSTGLAYTRTSGTVQITAHFRDMQGTAGLTVKDAVLNSIEVTPDNIELPIGVTRQYRAEGIYSDGSRHDLTKDSRINWSSGNIDVAGVNPETGLVTAGGEGETDISAIYSADIIGSTKLTVSADTVNLESIEVTPVDLTLPGNVQQQYKATGVYSDGSRHDITENPAIVWSTTAAEAAVISSIGLVTTQSPDSDTTLQVRAAMNEVEGGTDLTVLGNNYVLTGIQVVPAGKQTPAGVSFSYEAKGIYSNGTDYYSHDLTKDPNLSWSTDPSGIAYVINSGDDKGLATTLSAGETTVRAVFGDVTGTAELNVTEAELESIQVTPRSDSLPIGVSSEYTATGVYDDGTTFELNDSSNLVWSSTDDEVASIDSSGVVKTHKSGFMMIRASKDGVTGSTGLNVLSSEYELQEIQVTPAVETAPVGINISYTATGIYKKGDQQYTHDLTDDENLVWSTSDSGKASITDNGAAYTKGAGVVDVIATHNSGISGSAELTITAAVLDSIRIEHDGLERPVGVSVDYTATGIFNEGGVYTTRDITDDPDIMWTSSEPSVATVAAGGRAYTAGEGETSITTFLAGKSDSVTLTVLGENEAELESITISPAQVSIPGRMSYQFTAAGHYSNGVTYDLTDDADISWSSSDLSIASVSDTGMAYAANNEGLAVITAKHSGKTGEAVLSVTGASLQSVIVEPQSSSKPVGGTQQFTATAVYNDNTSYDITEDPNIMWLSGDTEKASVSSTGLAYAIADGTVDIKAKFRDKQGVADLTIDGGLSLLEIQVTPVKERKPAGVHLQYTATGLYDDGSAHDLTSNPGLIWSSSDETKAIISRSGLAYTIAGDEVTVRADFEGKFDTGSLTITDETLDLIQVTPADVTRPVGINQQYTATAFYSGGTVHELNGEPGITWSSSNSGTAVVNGSGLASTLAAGTTDITVNFDGITGSTGLTVDANMQAVRIEVTPVNQSKPVNVEQQYKAVMVYKDGDDNYSTQDITTDPNIVWKSSNTSQVIINNTGLALTRAEGTVTISATLGLTGSTSLTVLPADVVLESVQVTPSDLIRPAGVNVQYTATGFYTGGITHDLTTDPGTMWISDNTDAVSITGDGLAYTEAAGDATITAVNSGKEGETSLKVTGAELVSIGVAPDRLERPVGVSVQYTATGRFSDDTSYDLTNDPGMMWSADNVGRAVVNANGLLTTVGSGTVNVKASMSGITGTAELVVLDSTTVFLESITVIPAELTRPIGYSKQYTAIGHYSNEKTYDITNDAAWASSDPAVATAGEKGIVYTLSDGNILISATHDGETGTGDLNVTTAELSSIELEPADAERPLNVTVQYKAIGVYDDGTRYEITGDPYLMWSSLDSTVASIDGSGLAYTLTAGGTTAIRAALSGKTGSTSLAVYGADVVLDSIQITPSNARKPVGVNVQYTAMGVYTNGSSHDITVNPGTVWKSSTGAVSINSTGLATTIATGTPVISAELDTVTGSTGLEIITGELQRIEVSPANLVAPAGVIRQYTATGIYGTGTNTTIHDITNDPHTVWSSTGSAAVVSSTGMVQTVSAASNIRIDAVNSGKTGSGYLDVRDEELESIKVEPVNIDLPIGVTRQYTVTGNYSGDMTYDITTDSNLMWSSSDSGVAIISSTGMLQALSAGTIDISAAFEGKTNETELTVLSEGEAALDSIEITPLGESLPIGVPLQYTATGKYTGSADDTFVDLTYDPNLYWSSSAPAVASINSTGMATALSAGSADISAAFGGKTGTTGLTVKSTGDASLQSIAVTPEDHILQVDETHQYSVTGTYTGSITHDITNSQYILWSATEPTVAQVGNTDDKGTAYAISRGLTDIKAQHITASLEDSGELRVGEESDVIVTVTFKPEGGSDPIPPTKDVVESFEYGALATTSREGYTFDGWYTQAGGTGDPVESTTTVPGGAGNHDLFAHWVPRTYTLSFDAGDEVDDPTGIDVTFDAPVGGLPTPERTGYEFDEWNTQTDGEGTTYTADTVYNTPGNKTVHAIWNAKEYTVTFDARGGDTPDPVNKSVTFDDEYGTLAATERTGYDFEGWYTAEDGGGQKIESHTTVSIAGDHTLFAHWSAKEYTVTFDARGGDTPDTGSIDVTFDAEYGTLATTERTGYNFEGWYTAENGGGEKIESHTTVSIAGNHSLYAHWSPKEYNIIYHPDGGTHSGNPETYEYDQTPVSLNDAARGDCDFDGWYADSGFTEPVSEVPGPGWIGDKNVYAKFTPTLQSIAITPEEADIPEGNSQQYTAVGTYSDGSEETITSQVTWSSSDEGVVSISSSGAALGVAEGETTITAGLDGITSNSAALTVTPAELISIQIEPNPAQMKTERTLQFKATGVYTDGNRDITTDVDWSSSDTDIADINGNGTAGSYALTGETDITAQKTNVNDVTISSTVPLTVVGAELVEIIIMPPNPDVNVGMELQLTATGVYDDDSVEDLTREPGLTWSTDCEGLTAEIDNTVENGGAVTGIAGGSTTVTAEYDGISAETTLTVNDGAELVSISVIPIEDTIAAGTTRQFRADGVFSNNTTSDITEFALWSSTEENVAGISVDGLATGIGDGITLIKAEYDGKTGLAELTVKDAELQSITIDPSEALTIGYGTYQQFEATGHFLEQGAETTFPQNITGLEELTWTSSNPAVAEISNTIPTKGRATSLSGGSTTIDASLWGKSVDEPAVLEVKIMNLDTIEITPVDSTMFIDRTRQFTATGIYDDPEQTEQDITTQVLWSSTDTGVAVISNAVGSQGLAGSIDTGYTSISAKRDGITGSTGLTVEEDTESPNLMSASLYGENGVRVTFSEPVKQEYAALAANYLITESPQGSIGDNSNFTGSTQTGDFSISSVTVLSLTDYVLELTGTKKDILYYVIADKTAIEDLAANKLDHNQRSFRGKPELPEVTDASSLDSREVRVTFSEDMNETEARTIGNYKIVTVVSGSCEDNLNFQNSEQTSHFEIESISGSGNQYTLTLSEDQHYGTLYTVIVNRDGVHARSQGFAPRPLGCPNHESFLGDDDLKVIGAQASSYTTVILSFSKPVMGGENVEGSAECTGADNCEKRYQLSEALGHVTTARILDGDVCGNASADSSKVCVAHSNLQEGQQYNVTVANDKTQPLFDGINKAPIRDVNEIEYVQSQPHDRATFQGGGTPPQNFDDGPVTTDPFHDGTDFGYLATYAGKVYVGPSQEGDSATRFDPDGSNPETVSFMIQQDNTDGVDNPFTGAGPLRLGESNNKGATFNANSTDFSDTSTFSFPYTSIGFTGCTKDNIDAGVGCGPNNEDGRGLFTSGVVGDKEYLVITGERTGNTHDETRGFNYYLYGTIETTQILPFTYVDLYEPFYYHSIGGNLGTESIVVFADQVYWMAPGDRTYRPYLMQIKNLPYAPDHWHLSESQHPRDSQLLVATYMSGMGWHGRRYDGSMEDKRNRADIVGGMMFDFNNRLYIANSGSMTDSGECDMGSYAGNNNGTYCYQTGGVVRSTTDNPGPCGSGTDECNDWLDIAPADNPAFRDYFTDVLTDLTDLIPADYPIPGFAEYKGDLYMIRNACETSRWNRSCIGGNNCRADENCPAGQEVPQLWKVDTDDNWTLVADNTDDSRAITNMGNVNNTKITLVITNGDYLYVGYDNVEDGVAVYRTNVADPAAESDFEQIGSYGLHNSANKQIYDAVSLQQGDLHYLYISAGEGGNPVSVYRQQNE